MSEELADIYQNGKQNELLKKGSLTYDDLISVKAEDFKYFTAEDFINCK